MVEEPEQPLNLSQQIPPPPSTPSRPWHPSSGPSTLVVRSPEKRNKTRGFTACKAFEFLVLLVSCLPLLGDSDGEKVSALGFGAKEQKEG